MYSDYFDDPDGLSGAILDDGRSKDEDSDELDDDVSSDENGEDEQEMEITSTDLVVSNDNGESDNVPKSTLEKQQEKVGHLKLHDVCI